VDIGAGEDPRGLSGSSIQGKVIERLVHERRLVDFLRYNVRFDEMRSEFYRKDLSNQKEVGYPWNGEITSGTLSLIQMTVSGVAGTFLDGKIVFTRS
jgi:hypothetical protein